MSTKCIHLSDILNLNQEEYNDWTLCLNNATESKDGVYSFNSENHARLIEHISWKKSPGKKSFRVINTDYCLQFIRLDQDKKWDNWLFLGAFKVNGIINRGDGAELYDLQELDRFSCYKERLIIKYQKHQGDKQAKIDIQNIETIEVIEILNKPYIKTNKVFPGYDKVRLSFKELELLVTQNTDNWRQALSNVYGIYVITDTSTGKLYIGSAYGEEGIWQRWSTYVYTGGTGNNKGLINLLQENDNYAQYFQFSLLEVFFSNDSKYILDRENYWKKVFDSRNEHGNNLN